MTALLVFDLIIGFLLQVYFTLISRVFPERGRGRWLGALFAISSFVGVLAPVLAAGRFIREDATLGSYAAVFLTAFGLFVLGALPAFFLTERVVAPRAPRSFGSNAIALWRLWGRNQALRRYLLSRAGLEWGGLTVAFLATYSRLEANLSEHLVTWLGTLVVLVHAAASLAVGSGLAWLERRGHPVRRLYLGAQWVAQAFSLCALVFAAFGPAVPAALLLAIAAGLRMCAEFVIHPNILLEAGPRAARTDMLTLGAIVLMPATAIVQPVAGWGIALVGHRVVFALAGALAVGALVVLWRQVFPLRGQQG
jgi:MFS family permease